MTVILQVLPWKETSSINRRVAVVYCFNGVDFEWRLNLANQSFNDTLIIPRSIAIDNLAGALNINYELDGVLGVVSAGNRNSINLSPYANFITIFTGGLGVTVYISEHAGIIPSEQRV